MHRIAVVALVSASLFSGPIAAAEDAVKSLASALFINMAVTHYCRALDGEKDYQAARTLTKDVLTPLIGADDVVQHMDGVERALKEDPSSNGASASAAMCQQEKAEAMKRVEERRAKIAKPQ
ncbi:hypothetical protein GAO09_17315 [Rhizobiales bacterium RZME27]|uniref:Uncharacterized protein n=1 Tax=Endobacterium cereale TaxID=2663029 RepID=A0A6A8ACZ4_9HYPH|nr:hypothetical protein [Endobacterium cereale]MEB2847741.1 hypothetical protein [Endobacterium cereale]MQY47798.1 hypothetical protein [Endobacterium cereale]